MPAPAPAAGPDQTTAAAPPLPLLTLEKECIPPEGLPPHAARSAATVLQSLSDEDLATDAYAEAIIPLLRDEEYDLSNCETPRFDDAAPIQLETRGTTAYRSQTPTAAQQTSKQAEFWAAHTAHKNSVAAKLRLAGRSDLAADLEECHSRYTIALCNDCGRTGRFPNRCDRFYCPECQPRLAKDRKEAVGWWAKLAEQPKHVTLTIRNITDLSQGHVKEIKTYFKRLRARKFARNWTGGFYSIECTNEGRGWHLHIHALINARWIDGGELAKQWSNVTNGLGYIVKVKDARPADYLKEVAKYVAKGNQLAEWTPDQIRAFIEAFDGVRTFGVFGDLYAARTKFSEFVRSLRDAKPLCDCGSCSISYFTEAEWMIKQHIASPPPPARPPPQLDPQLVMLDAPPPAYLAIR